MLKTHLIREMKADVFLNLLNAFIKDKDVVDIKYQSGVIYDKYDKGCPVSVSAYDSALIIYREKDHA